MNTFKTFLLMAALTLLLVFIGGLFGRQGMIVALVLAGVINFVGYWFSDRIVLARYRAQEVDEATAPKLYGVVRRLAERGNLPMPKVYVLPEASPNAFATGRNPQHAAVAATEGLLQLMREEELEGVIAHELSHVRNRDILVGSVAATLAGTIMMLANWARWTAIFGGGRGRDREGNAFAVLLLTIVAAVGAMLIQMAISRSREYQADASGAQLSGNPLGLAHALARLEQGTARLPMQAEPATAHMFIVNPFSPSGFTKLFSTHPPIAARIARLEAMAGVRE